MKKFTMLLFMSILLVQVAFTQTVDVIYNVTREAYPTALPAVGASFSITYTNGANPAVTETKTVDATGAVTFTVPLPAAGTNYRLAETITLPDHNPYTSTSTNGTRITGSTSSPYYTSKFVGLTSTTLKVLVTKDVVTTGTPIAGASVTFTCANPVINTTVVTGADGFALLPVTRGSAADYTIAIAIAPIAGYATYAGTTQIIPFIPSGNLSTKNIAMMWLYPVNFTVTKSDGVTPVQGAVVTCTGTPASTPQTTGADGKAVFSKTKANFNYTILTPGYADTTATIQSATIVDPLNLTIKLRSAYNVNLTLIDASAALVTGALVTLKPKNSAIAATSVTTTGTGVAAFPKKTNGTYTYMITKSGFVDVSGELTVNDADINQAITLQAGADFTFTFVNGTNKVNSDTLTLNGITKFSSSSVNTLVFGLPVGTQNFTFTKSGWVKEVGSVIVDPAVPANNIKTLNLVPIYSLKVQTKDENNANVPYSFVMFNGNTYKTDATGTVIIPNIAPKAANERQYYDVRILKDGYGEYSDSIKCGLIAATNLTRNQIVLNNNLFLFSKTRIDINYSPSMAYANLSVNGIDRTGSIMFMGGGSIYNTAPGIYNYYMTYQTPGFAPARGSVEVKPNQNARMIVQFVAGYDIQMYTLRDGNPVEAYVTLDDTTMKSNIDDGGALFKMRREKTTYPYTAYQKDGLGKIIAKAKGTVILGSASLTAEVITLLPITDSILVKVYNAAVWGEVIPGATVKCDNMSYTTDAQGVAVIPVSANGEYKFTVSYAGYFDQEQTVTVAGENVNSEVYMNKQFSASFSVNDGTLPIEGAIIKIDGFGDAITGLAGTASFTKVFKNSWDAYTFTVSVLGYPDYTGTFYVSNGDVVVDPISFTTMAYDVTLTVNKPNGTPAPNAHVWFNNTMYTTNTLGMLAVTKVLSGSYPIVISAAGYIDYPETVTVADANVNQTIKLTGGYDLAIQVINGSTGTVGLANTSITINGVTKITDASGLVTFGVPANYAVNTTITKAGFADASLVIADVNANMTSTVYMTPVYNVNIRVMDNNSNNPIQGATVVFNSETKLSDVDGFAKFMNVAPSATAYAYSVTGPGTYNSSNGTIDLPLSSPAEYVENDNNVDKTVGLTSPYVYITLTTGMMTYYNAATINFDGVDYAYETGLGGNTFNCTLGTHTYVVTPADVTKAILRGSVVITELEPGAYVSLNVVDGRKVEIYVVDKKNEPIEGAEVVLNGLTIATDASGAAIYNRTVPGEYTYTVTKTGYISQTKPISVNTADVMELVTLLMPEYTLTFNLSDGTTPIAGANVIIGTTTITSGADGKAVFNGLVAGDYAYTVIIDGYSTKTGTVTIADANVTQDITLMSNVGINLKKNGSLSAYPNPTKGSLKINLPENGGKGLTISVTNIIGQVVIENKVVNSSTGFNLDLSGFDNGVYFVKVIGNGFQNTVKVVKN